MEIHNGDIIRFNNDRVRDWIAIESVRCHNKELKKKKDKRCFYLFGGLWYDGDATTDKPYGKCAGMLESGMLNNITIVGNINNKEDYDKYLKKERL